MKNDEFFKIIDVDYITKQKMILYFLLKQKKTLPICEMGIFDWLALDPHLQDLIRFLKQN